MDFSIGIAGYPLRPITKSVLSDNLRHAVAAAADKRVWEGLWHEILFYTAGELVAELVPGYTPYADKNGLWARQRTQMARDLIERDWRPHTRGTASLEESLTKLVNDLSVANSPQR